MVNYVLSLLMWLGNLSINLSLFLNNLLNHLDFLTCTTIRLVDPCHGGYGSLASDFLKRGDIHRVITEGKLLWRVVTVVFIGTNRIQFSLVCLIAEKSDQRLEG